MSGLIEPVAKQPPELEAGAAPVDGHVKVHVPGPPFVPEAASAPSH
jgi:hypothetical protein